MSSLTGLLHTLTWPEFPTRPGANPLPGQYVDLAATKTDIAPGGLAFASSSAAPKKFLLVDTFTVEVTFVPGESWVLSWLLTQPQATQDDMLNHEQGHYNIAALIGRDLFADVMLLKGTSFGSPAEGGAAVQKILAQTAAKSQAVQDVYDDEVHPEQRLGISRGPIQQAWDRLIKKAFTDNRTPASAAPDGTPNKVRLIDVLKQSGRHV